jgi:uncharacterized membrane protein
MNEVKIVTAMLALAMFFCVPQVQAQDTGRIEQISREVGQVQADFEAGKITPQQLNQRLSELNRQMEAAREELLNSGASFSTAQLQRMETLMDEDKRLEAQYNTGLIAEEEYARQANEVRGAINGIAAPFQGSPSASVQAAEMEKRIQQLWPGSVAGWPPAEGAFPRDTRDRSYLEVGDLTRPLRQASGTRASYTPGTRVGGVFGFIARYRIFQTGDGANREALEDLKRQIESATGKTMERNRSGDGYYLEFIDNRSNDREDGLLYWSTHSVTLRDGTLEYQVADTKNTSK